MSSSNHIKNVAIIGAGGHSGKYMTASLLATGNHIVTAITRLDSTSELPAGVLIKKVDYNDPTSLTSALHGQDALIITMGVMAPPDTQSKLIQAAADAAVPWVLPNEWSPDSTIPDIVRDIPAFAKMPKAREEIKNLGKSSFICVTTGFWYEWSLAVPTSYGVDIQKREVTFFDEGETKMDTSTFPQVGRAVAALLSLPIKPEGGDKNRCLEVFRNGQVYVASFTLSQRDMLESVLRVTETKMEDWTVKNQSAVERYAEGTKAMKEGDRMGFVKAMYTRMFYPDDSGNYGKTRGLSNAILGLPEEDLDQATKVAVERSKMPMYGM